MRQHPISVLSISGRTLTIIRNTLSRSCAGREICGFLLGLHKQGKLVISKAVVVRNGVARPGGFSISRSESKHVLRYAEKLGLMVCAVFHTHLERAQLSMTDRRWIEQSDIPWVIFSHGFHDESNGLRVDAYQPKTAESLDIEIED